MVMMMIMTMMAMMMSMMMTMMTMMTVMMVVDVTVMMMRPVYGIHKNLSRNQSTRFDRFIHGKYQEE